MTHLLSLFEDKAEVLAFEINVLLRLLEKVVVEVRLVQLDVLFAGLVRLALLRSRRACLRHYQTYRFTPGDASLYAPKFEMSGVIKGGSSMSSTGSCSSSPGNRHSIPRSISGS